MYKAKLWDEDKWNVHSSGYSSSKYANSAPDDKKEDSKYFGQKYEAKDKGAGSDYMRRDEHTKKEENKSEIFEDLDELKKDKQELNEEEIPFKAAREIFNESKYETKKKEGKKESKTIEDAIKEAIEGEKKVITMDS